MPGLRECKRWDRSICAKPFRPSKTGGRKFSPFSSFSPLAFPLGSWKARTTGPKRSCVKDMAIAIGNTFVYVFYWARFQSIGKKRHQKAERLPVASVFQKLLLTLNAPSSARWLRILIEGIFRPFPPQGRRPHCHRSINNRCALFLNRNMRGIGSSP
jgi:hypothetical protein